MNPTHRLLYLPNEIAGSPQIGFRRAIATLAERHLVEARIISLTRHVNEGDGDQARQHVLETILDYKPTHILLQHADGTGLKPADYRRWRASADAVLIYHEADPYGWIRNRTPVETISAARHADVMLVTGASGFVRKYRALGANDVRWVPQAYDSGSFGREEIPTKKTIDATIIANRSQSRLRVLGHPGAHGRARFVTHAQSTLGSKLALYGRGWNGPSARGAIGFWEQGTALAQSWLSLNWDHYPREALYFSNRLAISLASGTIHFTTEHPGYRTYFPTGARFIHFSRSPEELVEMADHYLSTTTLAQRQADIAQGMNWAHEHLRQDDLLRQILNAGGLRIPTRILGESRAATAEPMLEW